METKRARLMPVRRSLRFIEGPGAVQHQNGARVTAVVRGLHIFVAQVRGAVVNLPTQRVLRAAMTAWRMVYVALVLDVELVFSLEVEGGWSGVIAGKPAPTILNSEPDQMWELACQR